jgi:hypothetical protein
MNRGYRVVAVTPRAAKRASLQLLARWIGCNPCIDAWVVQPTVEFDEPDYLAALEEVAGVEVVPADLPPVRVGCDRFDPLYARCVDDETMYVRLDEGICWLEAGAVEALIDACLGADQPLVAVPFTLNTSYSAFLLQAHGRARLSHGQRFTPSIDDALATRDPAIAESLHAAFLQSLAMGDLSMVRMPSRQLVGAALEMPCAVWSGRVFAGFRGLVDPEQPDLDLSVGLSLRFGRPVSLVGEVAAVRFAAEPEQARGLVEKGLWERYCDWAGHAEHQLGGVELGGPVATSVGGLLGR